MKWHDALASTWLDLGPVELGGVVARNDSIMFQTLYGPGEIHRITFSDIREDHFTWRVDRSTDEGETWEESVMVIEASREALR